PTPMEVVFRHQNRPAAEPYENSSRHAILDFGIEYISIAHEICHELIGRTCIDVDRRADLLDSTPVNHDDLIAQRHCFLLIVGNVNGRNAELSQQPREFVSKLLTYLRIER